MYSDSGRPKWTDLLTLDLITPTLRHWISEYDLCVSPIDRETDPLTISTRGGETRLLITVQPDGWIVVESSDRFQDPQLDWATTKPELFERYLLHSFLHGIRAQRRQHTLYLPTTTDALPPRFTIQEIEFRCEPRLALITPNAHPLAIGSSDYISGTTQAVRFALFSQISTEYLVEAMLTPTGKPPFTTQRPPRPEVATPHQW